MTTASNNPTVRMVALAACMGALGCEGEQSGATFCVVDRDCPHELVCDDGACWAGAGSAGMGGSELGQSSELDAPDGDTGGDLDTDVGPGDGPQPGDDTPEQPGECNPTLTPEASRCEASEDTIDCAHERSMLDGRLVVWQTPLGTPPEGGWPAVVVFQGTGFGPDLTWAGAADMPFGGFNQLRLQAMLLDNGFAVIAPSTEGTAWATNFPAYELSADHRFIPMLLEAIAAGDFGPIDTEHLHATGISSGGYMTSRMAVTYPGSFRSLAIESGSYATCSNLACAIPADLPGDHPPTLFLHGENDIAVPITTAEAYHGQLEQQGVPTRFVRDPNVGHQWLDVAPEAVTCWFKEQ